MRLLKEKNKELKQRLDGIEQEEQSRSGDHTHTKKTTIAWTHTHQCSKRTKRPHLVDDDKDMKRHPFINEIMEAQLPSKRKGLNIKLFDGCTDPDEHLNVYKTQMNLYTANKVMWCKVFPTSLQEGALNWFTRLPPNSVDSLKAMAAKFTTQNTTSRPHHVIFSPPKHMAGKRIIFTYIHGEIQ